MGIHSHKETTMTMLDYPECYDCWKPAEKKCRLCGVLLCDDCYRIMNGLCDNCRELELNGDDDWDE